MEIKTIAFYNRPFPAGGAETVSRNLAYYFHSQGIRTIIYTSLFQADLLTEQDRKTFDVKVLPDSKHECLPVNVDFLRDSLELEQVDFLIIQGLTEFPFDKLYGTVHTKLIFCLHSIPLWEVYDWRIRKSSQLWNPTFLRRMEFIFLRKPVYRFTDKLKRRYLRRYAGIHKNTDKFVALCPEYYLQLYQSLKKFNPDLSKFAAIANPVLPAQEPTACPKEKTVLYVGRFSYCDKRVDRLLRIWKIVEKNAPDWRLILVGGGSEEANLRKLAAKLRLKRVEIAGYQTDTAPFYRRASFVCLTSAFEGFGMCLVEAQQYGAIPVSFDSYAAVREITENGEAGILVPPFSIRKYAQALLRAFADEKGQEQMRQTCYQAAARYELKMIGEQWLRLFRELDSDNKPNPEKKAPTAD